ncbi:hypothetical protein [Mycolicibacterium mageritense]|uniref:hypothetical protein n=1 Tax=Mycolicibacterium mageritense TaxID=53462 RepID=UPI0011D40EB7|nr:hypothetical protein [Mycolicibacterium mageritense]TXI62203.1 MAG: hypothetical protein E6Q55_13630 [Mycolicibacterium mageritense]
MSTFKFVASIIGFSLVTSLAIGVLSWVSLAVNHHPVPWQLQLSLFPVTVLLAVIITVAIDKPLDRP